MSKLHARIANADKHFVNVDVAVVFVVAALRQRGLTSMKTLQMESLNVPCRGPIETL